MKHQTSWSARRLLSEPGFRLGFIPVALLHLALSARSLVFPVYTTMGDRAPARWDRAHALSNSDDILAFLLEKGWPGDYGVHALLFSVGGLPLVLVVQLSLWLMTLALVYEVLRRYLLIPQWAAGTSTTIYALLASSLHQPHVIVTEAIFIPAVSVVVSLMVDNQRRRHLPFRRALALGGAGAVATVLRPVFLPVLPVVSVCLLAMRTSRVFPLVLANTIALVPVLVWAGVEHSHGKAVEFGGQGFSLEYNLARRMLRIQDMGGEPVPAALEHEASVGTYLVYSLQNPKPFIRATSVDLVMLVANSGVNHTYGRFFGFFDRSEGHMYWRPLLDERGFVAFVGELMQRGPAQLFWNGFALVTWGGFLLVTLVGWVCMRRGPDRGVAVILGVMFGTLVVGSLAATSVRWTHRSPMEFGLTILFSVGLVACSEWMGRRRSSSLTASTV